MKSWVARFSWIGFAGAALPACSDRGPATSERTAKVRAAISQPFAGELEPNGSVAQATALGDDVVVRANIHPDGDEDLYRFTAQAGNRVYATTMTARSSTSEYGLYPDTLLDIIAADGMQVLESDDDNGTITGLSSSIAGTLIPANGTYYVRVRKEGAGEIRPYDLHFRRQEGTPAAEVEPNDELAAKPLPASGWVLGSTSGVDDVDVYSLELAGGTTVFASIDLDPERDGVEWDGVLEFGPFDDTYLRANDPTDPLDAPSSEALVATVLAAGTYTLRVRSAGADFGSYALSVSSRLGTWGGDTCVSAGGDGPLHIPEGPGRVTAELSMPPFTVGDVDVFIELSHENPEDLDVHLRSPSGSDNVLFMDVGSPAFPDIRLIINDEAAFPLTPPNDPHFDFSGRTALWNMVVQPSVSDTNYFYRSANRLHWFEGENASGTWTLVIDDDSVGNSGTLKSWGLTICEAPRPTCPNGALPMNVITASFEAGRDGFAPSPDNRNNSWDHGIPSFDSGFTHCNDRSFGCWKTNLTGLYPLDSEQDLVSPPLDLTNAKAPITMSWAMKYQLESATFDHAWVGIREVGKAGEERRVWEFLDGTMREFVGGGPEELLQSAGWGVHTVDVSAYAGKTVELVFHLDSDLYVQFAGLAIDDVRVTHCGCGDGLVAPGEQCDLGELNGSAGACCDAVCRSVENGAACSDGSACTYDEVCTDGVCGGGKPLNCNDANVCTDDSCNPSNGCVNVNNTSPCSAGVCQQGRCVDPGTGGSGGTGGGGAGGAGAGGEDDGGEGGSSRGGSSTGARGGTESGGEGGAPGGADPRGGSNAGGTRPTGGSAGNPGGEGGEADLGPSPRRTGADSSCGCRVPGERRRGDSAGAIALLVAAITWSRRRRSLTTPRFVPRSLPRRSSA